MLDIVFETSRFAISLPQGQPGSSIPFGKDVIQWLIQRLQAHGVQALSTYEDGDGYEMEARHGSTIYWIAVRGSRVSTPQSASDAIWRIVVRKQRSLLERALGKNRMTSTDPLLWMIESALHAEKDITNVRSEPTAA